MAANQRRTPRSSVYEKIRPSLLGLFGILLLSSHQTLRELLQCITLSTYAASLPSTFHQRITSPKLGPPLPFILSSIPLSPTRVHLKDPLVPVFPQELFYFLMNFVIFCVTSPSGVCSTRSNLGGYLFSK
jgi:hypothetical protein